MHSKRKYKVITESGNLYYTDSMITNGLLTFVYKGSYSTSLQILIRNYECNILEKLKRSKLIM